MGDGLGVNKDPEDNELTLTDEEIRALITNTSAFSLQSVRASLEGRSKLFKYTWIILMTLTTAYLMGWFTGLIKPYMASSASGLEADYQIHQIRFLLAFGMLALGTAALNYNYYVRETFIVCAWVQFYFVVTGITRHSRTLPEESIDVLIVYTCNLVLILILLLILIFEESRLQKER